MNYFTDYLKHAPCLNDAHSLQKDCLTDLQAGLEVISTSDFQKRIPMACWYIDFSLLLLLLINIICICETNTQDSHKFQDKFLPFLTESFFN